MSARKIGGGRVLGRPSPQQTNSTPATATSTTPSSSSPSPFPKRHSSLLQAPAQGLAHAVLSPSASSLSLESSASTSRTSAETHTQDDHLGARVSLGHVTGPGASVAAQAAAASGRLICPICSEEMVTLLQLNRHLDDDHKNLEEVEQDEVKDWFEKQVKKAKKFQPLAILNQKLRGLDVFESNDHAASSQQIAPAAASGIPAKSPEPQRIDPDEVVTRSHWQRPGPSDVCAEPACGRRLNATNGKVNCRKCGKLFCEDHTMYQIKLSRSANHEPVRGFWCRVCETCYKSREGYNDHTGTEVNHTKDFQAMRRQIVDKRYLEVSRMEKRLTKLTQLLANPPEQNATTGGLLWPMASIKNQRKELEQSVVTWEDDASVTRCPFCQQEFSTYTFRRHHCRTCGRVICGDPRTECSSEVPLNVAAPRGMREKPDGELGLDVRMCKDCKHTIFGKRDFQAESSRRPADQRAYENLTQLEHGIRTMLPRFQKLLSILQDPERPPSPAQLADASRTRKRLMDAFTQYDGAGRRIRDMPTSSEAQKKLQKQIYQQVTNFLHIHMLPLQSLPKILKHAAPNGTLSPGQRTPNGKPNSLAAIKLNNLESASQVSGSSAISALEEEEKTLRDRLIVLEEQKFFVTEMIADANKRRKFDEVNALAQNVQDLSTEIDQIQGQIANLDFAAVYTGSGPGTPMGR